ncbi:MAG: spore maturation protein [Clostridia bacterium]|nr:spore maturation protein [Clostridia bacterium]MBO5439388.1 spore maturation protein [Clostridia bacterium]
MEIVNKISYFVLPCVVILVAIIILVGKRDYFSCFLRGAKGGLKSAFGLIPSMCALIIGVNMLFASGATEIITGFFAPLLEKIGVPSDILPLILTRPLSFGASLASFTDIVDRCGVDSLSALCASVIMSSTDTVFYVACVYFSSSEIKKTRYFLPVALFVSLLSVFLSCMVTRLFF